MVFDGRLGPLRTELMLAGPFDRIEDHAGGAATAKRLPELLLALRRGGVLSVVLPGAGSARARVDVAVAECVELGWAEVVAADPSVPASMRVELRALTGTLALVREQQMDRLLASVPETGREIHRVAGESDPATTIGSFRSPDLVLRELADVICAPRMLCVQGARVLSPSFRRPLQQRPVNKALDVVAPGRARDPGLRAQEHLPGAWYYLDNAVPSHFGHVVTEQLATTWAIEAAAAAHPDLRFLLYTRTGEFPRWHQRMLAAAGVDLDRVTARVVTEGPVAVEHLLAATPGYAVGQYAHPLLRELYPAVGDRLAQNASSPTGRRIFWTRDSPKRACRNRAEVEARFAAAGFDVLAPESLDIAEQIAAVRSADVVAGFSGSNMFHVAFAPQLRQVIALASTTYPADNEPFLTRLHGVPLSLLRGRALTEPSSASGIDLEAFHSDYEIDLADVDSVLADLD